MPQAAYDQRRLLAYLAEQGFAVTTHEHDPVFTVAEAQAIRADMPGVHIKNLFLKDKKDALFLVVAEETRPLDLKDLQEPLGAARLSFGKPDLLAAVLGVTPGAVTPFAALNDAAGRVTVALDRAILAGPPVHAHPLVNTATTAIAPDDLVAFLESCQHPPLLLDL